MTDYPVVWDTNFRTILRLWPKPTPNIEDMIALVGQTYDEVAFVHKFRPGKGGERSGNTRVIRNTSEALQYAGLAYRSDRTSRWVLSPLGQSILSFLGITGGRQFANAANIHLAATIMIRAACSLVEQRAILMLMRQADNQLTNDELLLATGLISRLSDIPRAAAAINQARADGTVLPMADRNKMTPQFLLAGGGGMFISVGDDRTRRIPEWALSLIDETLKQEIIMTHATTSAEAVLSLSETALSPPDFGTRRYGTATESQIDKALRALQLHGTDSIIALSGVPGTGKTFVSLVAAQRYTGSPLLVETIHFHQAYTYEDFIEGLRPTSTGGFVPSDGVFTKWNEQALRDPANKYVLLIEEFSRANISAVLGELMTFIEHRERTFTVPLTRRLMRVAPNLTILVTMNPRDRSALEVDDALLRRMRIIDCPPDVGQLDEMLQQSLHPTIGIRRSRRIISGLTRLFQVCSAKSNYREAMPFGHGIFAGLKDEADLQDLYEQRIRYLLRRPLIQPHEFADDIEQILAQVYRPASEVSVESEETGPENLGGGTHSAVTELSGGISTIYLEDANKPEEPVESKPEREA